MLQASPTPSVEPSAGTRAPPVRRELRPVAAELPPCFGRHAGGDRRMGASPSKLCSIPEASARELVSFALTEDFTELSTADHGEMPLANVEFAIQVRLGT